MSANKEDSPITPESTQSGDSRDSGQVFLVVLVIFALLASVIMLFSGSVDALKIALLAALWAAVLGFVLVVRYRNQAESTRRELEDAAFQHEREMASAERRYAALEAKHSEEIERFVTFDDKDKDTLQEINAQLSELRNQLEYLTGQLFVEPTMIRAEARRIQELSASADSPAAARPATAEQPVVFPAMSTASEPEAPAEPHGQHEAPGVSTASEGVKPEHEAKVESEVKVEDPKKEFDTTSFAKVQWVSGGDASRVAPVEKEPEPEAPRGRRRRDEHSQGISVAELMKQRKKKNK